MPPPVVNVVTERTKLYDDEFQRMLQLHYKEEDIKKLAESGGLSPKNCALWAIQNWYEHPHLVLYVNHFLEDTDVRIELQKLDNQERYVLFPENLVAPVPLGPDGTVRQIISELKSPNEIEREEILKIYKSEFSRRINLVYSNEETKEIQRNREISRLIDSSDMGTALYYIQTYYEHPQIVFFANHFLEKKEMTIVLQNLDNCHRYVVLPQEQVAPVPKNPDGTERQIIIPPDCPTINKFRQEMIAYGLRMSEIVFTPYRKEWIRKMYDDYELAHPDDQSAFGFILLQMQIFYEDPNVVLKLNSYLQDTGITIKLRRQESRYQYLILPQNIVAPVLYDTNGSRRIIMVKDTPGNTCWITERVKAFGLEMLETIDVVNGKEKAKELYDICDLVHQAEPLPMWIAHIHAKIFYEYPAIVSFANHYLRKMEILITKTCDGLRYFVDNRHNNKCEMVEIPKNMDGTDRKFIDRPVEGVIVEELLRKKYCCTEMLARLRNKGFTTKGIEYIYRCSNITDESDPSQSFKCPSNFAQWIIRDCYDHPSIVHFANNFLEGSGVSIALIRPDRYHYVLRPDNIIVRIMNPDGQPSELNVNPDEEFAVEERIIDASREEPEEMWPESTLRRFYDYPVIREPTGELALGFCFHFIRRFYPNPSVVLCANTFLKKSFISIELLKHENRQRYVILPHNILAPIPLKADGTEYEIFEWDNLLTVLKGVYPKEPFY